MSICMINGDLFKIKKIDNYYKNIAVHGDLIMFLKFSHYEYTDLKYTFYNFNNKRIILLNEEFMSAYLEKLNNF